jgi:biotin-(acetyl-CoA carboxylase) ligase
VARAIFAALADPPAELNGAALEALRGRDALLGRAVSVSGGEALEGTALGISPAGALLVRARGGALRTVRSGSVRLSEARPPAE